MREILEIDGHSTWVYIYLNHGGICSITRR